VSEPKRVGGLIPALNPGVPGDCPFCENKRPAGQHACDACLATQQRRTASSTDLEAERRKAVRARLLPAYETIEAEYRGLSFSRVGMARLEGRMECARARESLLVAYRTRPIPKLITFVGPTGTGKTSGAIAMMGDLLRRAQMPGAPERLIELAAGARVVEVGVFNRYKFTTNLGGGLPREWHDGLTATLLILDDVGIKTDDAIVRDILASRFRRHLHTFVTTTYPDYAACVAGLGDGGLARRMMLDTVLIDTNGGATVAPSLRIP
jgi:DNA replication protein DnaC